MALFGRDYDREYGYRGNAWGRGYDRGYRSGWGTYDRDDTYRGMTRDNRGWGMTGYDREYGAAGYGAAGYDRGYKSRWETDYGDPFGDRSARTPMRMIRGEYHSGYDRGYRGSNRNLERGVGYGRDYYETNPAGYDPNASGTRGYREGTWMRGNRRGYDSGWF